eukprot:2040052-Rhodomonas_salina.2
MTDLVAATNCLASFSTAVRAASSCASTLLTAPQSSFPPHAPPTPQARPCGRPSSVWRWRCASV